MVEEAQAEIVGWEAQRTSRRLGRHTGAAQARGSAQLETIAWRQPLHRHVPNAAGCVLNEQQL